MAKADWTALYTSRRLLRRFFSDRFHYGPLKSWERDMFLILSEILPAEGSVLSVGCGRGLIDYWLAMVWGADVHLVDLSGPCLDKVRRSFGKVPHHTYKLDALELPFDDGRFDLVWNAGVWEHFSEDDVYRGIGQMCRVCRGHVVTSVPYASCKPYLLAKQWLENNNQWVYGDEYPKNTLRPYFQRRGVEQVEERLIGSEETCWNYVRMVPDEKAREEIVAQLDDEDFRVFPHIVAVADCRESEQ